MQQGHRSDGTDKVSQNPRVGIKVGVDELRQRRCAGGAAAELINVDHTACVRGSLDLEVGSHAEALHLAAMNRIFNGALARCVCGRLVGFRSAHSGLLGVLPTEVVSV